MLKLLKNSKHFQSFCHKKALLRSFSSNSENRGINRKKYDKNLFITGNSISKFTLEKIQDFPDFNITSYTLSHKKTGAQFVHLDTSDQNNCFAIIFKTLPDNDKGLYSHIIFFS